MACVTCAAFACSRDALRLAAPVVAFALVCADAQAATWRTVPEPLPDSSIDYDGYWSGCIANATPGQELQVILGFGEDPDFRHVNEDGTIDACWDHLLNAAPGDPLRVWIQVAASPQVTPALEVSTDSSSQARATIYPNASFDASGWYVRLYRTAATLPASPGVPWSVRAVVKDANGSVIYDRRVSCSADATNCAFGDTWAVGMNLYETVSVRVSAVTENGSVFGSASQSIYATCD